MKYFYHVIYMVILKILGQEVLFTEKMMLTITYLFPRDYFCEETNFQISCSS